MLRFMIPRDRLADVISSGCGHFPEQQFVFGQRGTPVSISSWGLLFRIDAVLAGVSDD